MDWSMICYSRSCDTFVENYAIQKWHTLTEEGLILC